MVGAAAYRTTPGATQAARALRQAAARWQATEPLEVLGASPMLATVRVRVPPGQEDAIRVRLLALPEVEAVERNGRMWADEMHPRRGTSYVPAAARDEPNFPRQAWHYDVIGAPFAWEVTTGSSNVIVAVVDDGIRFDHPDIAGNLTSDGYDFVSEVSLTPCTSGTFTTSMDGDGPDPDPTIPASLDYDSGLDCVIGLQPVGGHGLHVAGTVGAPAGNGIGGVGVAWNVSIRPVRVLGSGGTGTNYDIAQGILYAAGLPADGGAAGMVQAVSGADIINLSLGGPAGSTVLQDAVQAASNAGALVIASAGNEGSSIPNYPASYPEVVSVSAIAPDGTLATYSSFGSTVDIAAPGGELVLGSDYGVQSLVWDFQNALPGYVSWNGTSMAAPHVSGVAALVLSADPGLSASQLRARLVDHAIDLGPTGPDDSFGAGLVFANGSVRNGVGAPRDTYVMVTDALDGTLYGPVAASPSGGYSISALPDASYRVYVGQDRNGDLLTGYFDRRWGALGGSTTPATVTISQSSIEAASFSYGFPIETEANGTLLDADPMLVGGYAFGTISPSGDVDLYKFEVPASMSIVVETDAFIGACGFAGQVDTIVRLLDVNGLEIAQNDDVNTALERRCSRLTGTLPAGTYYVEVTGWSGDVGPYAVRIGKGG